MTILHVSADAIQLEPVDIGIKELEGKANVLLHTLQSEEEPVLWSGITTFDRCTFDAAPENRETFIVLEGDATIESDDGEKFNLGPGDLVVTPKGSFARWIIRKPVKLFFVMTP